MLQKLSKTERKRLREKYEGENHPLFLACDAVFTPRTAHLNSVTIETEEVFCAVVALLDTLFRTEHITQQFVDSLWTQLFRDIRLLKPDATEHDKNQVTHTVFSIVKKLLSHHWDSHYCDTLFDMLTHTMGKECREANNEETKTFFERLMDFSDVLDNWINNAYDFRLSSEIVTVIKGKAEEKTSQTRSGRKAKDLDAIVETFDYMSHLDNRGARLQAFYDALKGRYIDKDTDLKDFLALFQNTTTKAKVVWIQEIIKLKYLITHIEKYITCPQGFTQWQITCAHFKIRIVKNKTIDNKAIKTIFNEDLQPSQFSKGGKMPQKVDALDKIIRILDPKMNYKQELQDYLDNQQEHDEIKDTKDALANGLNTDISI